ncbi:MAG: leucine-rich repeat protein [Lachnospiraceae bacterium]|nr:leucine-rich repeat protein [Lachnospiraceae bacterium]
MRKKAYKWLSVLLTVSMLASGVPAYAAGAGDVTAAEAVAEDAVFEEEAAEEASGDDAEEAVEEETAEELPEQAEAEEDESVVTEEPDGDPVTVDGFELTVIDEGAKTAAITGYTASDADLYIPDELGGYKITEIGTGAFAAKQFTGVRSFAPLTKIGDNAFRNCDQMKTVLISGSKTDISIGTYAFAECDNLKEISLPDEITELPAHFAYSCGALETINWPKKLKKIGSNAFQYDAKLKSPDLSHTEMTEIGENAFRACSALPVVILPRSTDLNIGATAFFGCGMYNGTSAGELYIPPVVKSIGEGAFQNCSGLGSVVLSSGDSGTVIQKNAFSDCSSLTDITLEGGLKALPESFAQKCSSLQNVSFPAGLSSIGASAFYQDSKLKNADLSGTALTEIGDNAFRECTALPAVKLPSDTSLKIGSFAFAYCSIAGTLTVSRSVTELGACAFIRCSGLTEVNFEAGSESITMGNSIFSECASLKKITLSSRTATLPANFAYKCKALESVIWAPELTSIGNAAFKEDEKLKSSDLSEVTALSLIGPEAFSDCTDLPVPVLPEESALKIGKNAFRGCNLYDGNDNGVLVIPANVTELGEGAFQGCNGLESVRMEDGESSLKLGAGVFRESELLTSLFLSARVTDLPDYFVYGCNRLVWIDGGMAVESVGNTAFLCTGPDCEIVLTNCNMILQGYSWYEAHRKLVDAAVSVVLKDSYTVEEGKSLDLKPQYIIVPENAKLPELYWDSEDESIVKATSKGVVKGVSEGSASITVSTAQGIVKARVLINVTAKGAGPEPEPEVFVPVPGGEGATDPQPLITESTTKLTLVKGQKFILGNKDWKSGDSKTLKVSKNTLTAKKAGNVTLSRPGHEDIAVEIVVPAFDKKNITMAAGDDEIQLTLCGAKAGFGKIRLSDTAELPIVFSSSAPDVANVDSDGTVYAKSRGKAVITAWINGVAFKCTVKVQDVQKPSFDFSQMATPLVLKPNQSVTVKTKGFNAKKANWSSSRGATAEEGWAKGALYEDGVIRISKGGKLTAIGTGDSQITAVSGDLTLNFRVEVSAPVNRTLHMNVGKTASIKLYGEKGTIEWAIVDGEDEDVVSFEKGKIKAEKCGRTLLYAKRGGFTYYLNVFVEDPTIVGSAAKTPYKMTIEDLSAGDTASFKLTGIAQDVVFKSNKSNVAFVSPLPDAAGNYIITARSKGTAKLTAKVNGKSITITVKVK